MTFLECIICVQSQLEINWTKGNQQWCSVQRGSKLDGTVLFAFCLTNTASVHNTGNVLMCGRLQPSVTLALL